MNNSTDELINQFSRTLNSVLSECTVEDSSIPKEYFDFDGFRLTEPPREKLKVLFLGDFGDIGEQRVKLAPKFEWLFCESDTVVINLKSGISIYPDESMISSESFLDFCDQIIPEKVIFNLCSDYFVDCDPTVLQETLGIIESVGARSCGSMLGTASPIAKELILKIEKGSCRVESTNNTLAVFGNNSQGLAPIQVINRVVNAESLGCFVSKAKSKRNRGLMTQIEFARYEKWTVRRVVWESLRQQTSHNGSRLVV
ncbi:MAG: hypothetical protein KC478_06275 [Bacteriovoracaceae bacterium]|nr:hypothetical protein [Bacteriovoracaceae bacterium]